MSFCYEEWIKRIANRSDITSMLTHLTKPIEKSIKCEKEINIKAVDNLVKILKEEIINGSTTQSGYIVGNESAVCFQDAPFYGLIQNVEYEKRMRMNGKKSKIRYCGVGLAFFKDYVYEKGARPVIYEQTDIAKKLLPKDELCRIVNLQLDRNKADFIDWTHEREWRLPGNFQFDIKKAHIILYDKECWDYFNKTCPRNILNSIYGITIIKSVLM